MRYWEKPNGDCGTMPDEGTIPPAGEEITEVEYNDWLTSQTTQPINGDPTEYQALTVLTDKIDFIARMLGLIE